MHDAAYRFVESVAREYGFGAGQSTPQHAIELGAYNVNGSVRDLFPDVVQWTGVDVRPGPGVDVVMPAEQYQPAELVDLVVCTEVLEHTPHWREVIQNAYTMLYPGGTFIVTAAGPMRKPHGCNGGDVGAEYYQNIAIDDLQEALQEAGFVVGPAWIRENEDAGDVYAVGGRPVEDGAA